MPIKIPFTGTRPILPNEWTIYLLFLRLSTGATVPTVPTTPPSQYSYVGCYADRPASRDMGYQDDVCA